MAYSICEGEMARYIWQSPSWPDVRWDSAALLRPLGKARQVQGKLLGESAYFELELQAEVLTWWPKVSW